MDKLDTRIVREALQGEPLMAIWPLRYGVTPDFRLLSNKTGAAESTLRARWEKLSGFLSGWTLMLNPGLLGVTMGALLFEVPGNPDASEIVKKLALVEDMLTIKAHTGHLFSTTFFSRDEFDLRRKIDLISELSGCDEHEFSEIPSPRCSVTLSMTDLRIIESRQGDFGKSNQRISRELGVSSRTVKRRMTRMVTERTAWGLPSMNLDALKEGLYADLIVWCKPELRAEAESEIQSMVDGYLVFNGRFVSFSAFSMMLPSVPLARTILANVRRLNGVEKARLEFVEERLELYDTLRAQVKRRITEMRAQNRPARPLAQTQLHI